MTFKCWLTLWMVVVAIDIWDGILGHGSCMQTSSVGQMIHAISSYGAAVRIFNWPPPRTESRLAMETGFADLRTG